MFKTQNLQLAVRDLLQTIEARSSKIQERIEILQEESTEVDSQIGELMTELINYEIEENDQGQAEVNKKLAKLRSRKSELHDKIKAYQSAAPAAAQSDELSLVKKELPKIVSLAKKQQKERAKNLDILREQKEKLLKEIKELQDKATSMDWQMDSMYGHPEAKIMLPLLRYIESRPIKHGFEESYLSAYLEGADEFLEQYIEKPDITRSNHRVDLCISPRPIPAPSEGMYHKDEIIV
ncbi:MAG: hypothetical protein ACRKFN_11570 [Desulfitobacterium sp.]